MTPMRMAHIYIDDTITLVCASSHFTSHQIVGPHYGLFPRKEKFRCKCGIEHNLRAPYACYWSNGKIYWSNGKMQGQTHCVCGQKLGFPSRINRELPIPVDAIKEPYYYYHLR